MTRHNIIVQSKCKDVASKMTSPSNKVWRYVAYRSFVSWVNSWTSLGKNNRIVIPSCVINAIREEFPEEVKLNLPVTIHDIVFSIGYCESQSRRFETNTRALSVSSGSCYLVIIREAINIHWCRYETF
jgi:hypothetical protein